MENPVALVQEILEDITKTNTQRSRHLIRLVPIQKTCKAFENSGNLCATQLKYSHSIIISFLINTSKFLKNIDEVVAQNFLHNSERDH